MVDCSSILDDEIFSCKTSVFFLQMNTRAAQATFFLQMQHIADSEFTCSSVFSKAKQVELQ